MSYHGTAQSLNVHFMSSTASLSNVHSYFNTAVTVTFSAKLNDLSRNVENVFLHGLVPLTRSYVEPTLDFDVDLYTHTVTDPSVKPLSLACFTSAAAACRMCDESKALLWNEIIESMQRYIIQERCRWFIIQRCAPTRHREQKIKGRKRWLLILVMVSSCYTFSVCTCVYTTGSYVVYFWLWKP